MQATSVVSDALFKGTGAQDETGPAIASDGAGRAAKAGFDNPVGIAGGCSQCRLRSDCLASDLSRGELDDFKAPFITHRRVKFGGALFRATDPFRALYRLRSGFVKTSMLLPDGREQVTGFHMPGALLGLDAVGSGFHPSDAVALDECDVCVMPYDRLEDLSVERKPLACHVQRLLSAEIVREQSMMLLLGSMQAEERVASLLLNLSERFAKLGYSPSEFILRMTRDEIGSLLGMNLETVSRVFSKLCKAGMIEIHGKHVRIIDMERLRAVTQK